MPPSTTSKQQEALEFLNDLDSISPSPSSAPAPTSTGNPPPEEAAEVLAFLDEITQKSSSVSASKISTTSRPGSRGATERVTLRPSASSTPPLAPTSNPATASPSPSAVGGWGWGNVWSTASAAIQQAKTAVDESVKNLPIAPIPIAKNDQARKWGEGVMEYVKSAQLDKLGKDIRTAGLSTLTEILNAVAPPIAEHEVLQVWLSHDMEGYDGVENVVYRAFLRMLEQVKGGDLTVIKGNESRPKEKEKGSARELNAVEGYESASKLAEANIASLIKSSPPSASTPAPSSIHNPTIKTTIYLRLQPFTSAPQDSSTRLSFLLSLSDPVHSLSTEITTQSVPLRWLDLSEGEGAEWVEEELAECLRVGVEVLGMEYLVERMGWGKEAKGKEKEVIEERDVTSEKV